MSASSSASDLSRFATGVHEVAGRPQSPGFFGFVSGHQDLLVYCIVAISASRLLWRGFRFWVAPWLARVLLRRGKVGWAMRLRSLS
jgi:hypothetical protein